MQQNSTRAAATGDAGTSWPLAAQPLAVKDLRLLASCAYLSGDYLSVLKASERLAQNPATEAEGLYWETKSAENLATQSLARASAADPNSPKLHVLAGGHLSSAEECSGGGKGISPGFSAASGGYGRAIRLGLGLARKQADGRGVEPGASGAE